MTKKLGLLIASVLCVSAIFLAGCGDVPNDITPPVTDATPQNTSPDNVNPLSEQPENVVPDTNTVAETPSDVDTPKAPTEQKQPDTAPPKSTNTTTPKQTPSKAEYIGKEKAEQIALSHFGLSRGQVRLERTELDRDDRIAHYEVEFRQGNYEYDVEVSATDGAILKAEKDYDD